ncbi:MAG: hypothetical protein K0Q94_735 [Paenibacillus sp.]|jgi:ubiquinone biosynthesis protein|uniref:ABC1 kinase family protein n=1 Tax=Paenibacillus sp. GCM10012303 TaxID=3317340 RepID=UPI0029ECDF65|nr:hypothetical protein [Paenibacillus sp.]
MDVGKKLRHLHRYQEIARAFVRNGFGYVAKELGLPETLPYLRRKSQEPSPGKTLSERIRLFLEELGPTFVKLGQIASTRPDLIPPELIVELERLQDRVAPFPFEQAARIIEEELGAPLSRLFAEFEETPMAAASIGQVYRALLPDGAAVAVKVQRPNIRTVIETDLDILTELAKLAEHRMEWARSYRLADMMEEMAKALLKELDYEAEARNTEKCAAICSKLRYIRIPGVYRKLSSKKVLTMEFVDGIKLSDQQRLLEAGCDRKLLAERYATTILHQVLIDGFFHGDPHPGNVLALPDGKLALLDFGMVGKLSPEMKHHFASFVIALRNQSTSGVIRAIFRMGLVPDETDLQELRADVDEMRDKYYKVPLKEVSMGEAVNDLFALALRHNIRIPADLTLLGKTFLTMEGVVTALDPSFSIFDVAEPFGRRLLLERFDPRRAASAWLRHIPDYVDMLNELPMRLRDLMTLARKGKIGLEVTAPDLEWMMKKMDRIVNRISFSIVLLSFCIIMVGLMIALSMGNPDTVLWKIPVIEIGFGFALIMFGWLFIAIFRSGRF